MEKTPEHLRLAEDLEKSSYWKKWGPYLSERQWATVREDYSQDGDAWNYFPHDHAPMKAYRWGEDGIAGISDNHQRLCFALAFWNGKDSMLKERLFGVTPEQGNHGEDVKECYYYLDNTPTHSYMSYLYKYPQSAFPYSDLINKNKTRGLCDPEHELFDTGIFDNDRYFDILVEYAKKTAHNVKIRITVKNLGPEEAVLHVLPTLWFRNTWSYDEKEQVPRISLIHKTEEEAVFQAVHGSLGTMWLKGEGITKPLFTNNETNLVRFGALENTTPYVKDAFHTLLIRGLEKAVNPKQEGTKSALHYELVIPSGEERVIRLCLQNENVFVSDVDEIIALRKKEADLFYDSVIPKNLNEDQRKIERQAFAGMLWNKQRYHYVVERWLEGDPGLPKSSEMRKHGRNFDWKHLYSDDILSLPDKWEYPWFASWDTAFHCLPLALIDLEFAKKQLLLLTREWYMHPNGQIPACEWNFCDVNPPVHAWSAWRVYKMGEKREGKKDVLFLERVFQKLLLYFTWWVNRKDADGRNLFQGGFLGLDNISLFDRSAPLPSGGHLTQADGTSWMGMFCLNMLQISLELALHNKSYEDIASKFFEHFLYIAEAMTHIGDNEIGLWDKDDNFFYDVVHHPDGTQYSLKVRSFVGLIPLFAVMTLDPELLEKLPDFRRRFDWFVANRADLCQRVASLKAPGEAGRRLLSIVDPEKLKKILEKVLDSKEFLGDYGVRSVSLFHKENPYTMLIRGKEYRVDYSPGESPTTLFGGNSNWRGPIWFPLNYLLVESLQKFHHYLGRDYKVEFPTGSGKKLHLWDVASEISDRLIAIFEQKGKAGRPVFRNLPQKMQKDPHFKDHLLFYEFFHGDTGAGLGASHQTGWTGLVAKLLQQRGEYHF